MSRDANPEYPIHPLLSEVLPGGDMATFSLVTVKPIRS